jgi:hypothetical protein
MSILPVDEDVLENVCRNIAKDNYGFIYIADDGSEIKSAYESSDLGLTKANSISLSEMRKTLTEMANDEFAGVDKLRDDVYYVDPFDAKGNMQIPNELTNLFSQRIVVTAETLRSRFSIAIDDLEHFAEELVERGWVQRISAGRNDYYTIGDGLKEHRNDVTLDSQLVNEASNGKISHRDLEDVIDVDATSDVIRYLDREDYIVDLDGEYLVEDSIDEYGHFLSKQIEDTIEGEFESSEFVLIDSEFEKVVENAIDDKFNVLSEAREAQRRILDETRNSLQDRLGLKYDTNVVKMEEEFSQMVEDRARRILNEIQSQYDKFASPSDFMKRAEDEFDELNLSNDEQVNNHIQDKIKNKYENIVNEEKF